MRKTFVPKDFKVPAKVGIGSDYYLVAITTKEVVEDWLTLTSNADAIIATRGGGSRKEWPYICTLEENLKDLAWLELCANYNHLFSYILRSKKDNSYVGCIYIYLIELFYPEKADKYDVDFSFWAVQSELDKGNYSRIFNELLNWLKKDWPFEESRIFLRNKNIPDGIKV